MNDYWKAFWDCKPIRIVIFSFLIFTASVMFGDTISSFIGFSESKVLNDIIVLGFLVLMSTITITFSFSDHYNFQYQNFLVKVVISLSYLVLRFKVQNNFVLFHWFDNLYYLDMILFILLIIPFTPSLKMNRESIDFNDEILNPIIHLDHNQMQDRLSRKNLVKQICAYILSNSRNISNSSINISLTGDWGSGKTYIKDQLKAELDQKNVNYRKSNYKYFFTDFTPWSITDKDTINEHFIRELLSNLSKVDRATAALFKKYFDEILNVSDNFYVNMLKASKSIFYPELKKDKLSDQLETEKIKVIVFIDDIDRLQKEEILELLKFIRNNGDISGITYICLFDQDYVLRKVNEDNDVKYLRKFFNLSIGVGSGQINYYNEFEDLLYKYIQDPNHVQQLKWAISQLDDINKQNFKKIFGTIRDMKIFFNNFLFVYQYKRDIFSRNFISVIDLFLLELIKFNYPKLYNQLQDIDFGKSYEEVFNEYLKSK